MKSKFSISVFVSALFLLGINSCIEGDNRLRLINKSDHKIFYIWSIDTVIGPDEISLNDSFLVSIVNMDTLYDHYRSLRRDSVTVIRQRGSWESNFDFDEDGTHHLFIFFESTIQEHSWKEITENNLYDQRLDLKLEDLKNRDWLIVIE